MKGKIKIAPRSARDRGGYITMPLKANVPHPQDGNWKLTTCPICKRECWERPAPAELTGTIDGMLCTECAIREVSKIMEAGGERT